MASSSKTIKTDKCDDDNFDVTEAPVLAKLDNEPIDTAKCDEVFYPELADADGCDNAIVQLRSRGQGRLRHGDTLRAEIQVMEPLTASADKSKLELGKLPWPVENNDSLDIVPVAAVERDECADAGYWSDRPGQHPFFKVGRLAWPVDCNGEPAEEVDYNPEVGTYRTREGHPVIHKPKAPCGCEFSPIWKFSNTETGALPAIAKDPLSVGLINEDCCCTLNLSFSIHYTYTINRLKFNSGGESNLSFKGYAGETGTAPRCWTFEQCKMGDVENKIISGHSTVHVSIPPKNGTTVNFWTEIGLGSGETVQPQVYNINSQIEACYIGGLDC